MDIAGTRLQRNSGRVREPLDRPRGRGRAVSAGRGGVLPRHRRGVRARAARARSDDRRGAAEGLAAQAHRGDVARGAARRRLRARPIAATCRRASWSPNMSTSPRAFVDERRDRHGQRGARPACAASCAPRNSRRRVRSNPSPDRGGRRAVHVRGRHPQRRRPPDRELFQPLATHPGALGLTDDAAFLTPEPGTDLVLKTDAVVAGVHFFRADDACEASRRRRCA